MDSSLLELLSEITLYHLIIVGILIVSLVGIGITQKKKISKVLNKWRKDKNDEENFVSLVYELKDSIEKLSQKVQENQDNRDKELLQYREDSKTIRDEMYKVINGQSESIKTLAEKVDKMEEKNSKTKRAELKERIERIYAECHPNMRCTDTQFETLKDLIEEYEAHGGVNSFVHSLVEPEMYEWEKVVRT